MGVALFVALEKEIPGFDASSVCGKFLTKVQTRLDGIAKRQGLSPPSNTSSAPTRKKCSPPWRTRAARPREWRYQPSSGSSRPRAGPFPEEVRRHAPGPPPKDGQH